MKKSIVVRLRKLPRKTWVLMATLVLGALYYVFYVPPEPEVEGHFFFRIAGEPFLVPQAYMYDSEVWEGRNYSSFNFKASLPGLGPDGEEAAKDWKNGSPLLVSVSVEQVRESFTKMGVADPDAVLAEELAQNKIEFNDDRRQTNAYLQDQGFDFQKDWNAFVAANRHREWELINADALLNLPPDLSNPESDFENTIVAFSGGRMVWKMNCSKSKNVPSPHCLGEHHRPNDKFSLLVFFHRTYDQSAVDIVHGARELVERWNQAGRAHAANEQTE